MVHLDCGKTEKDTVSQMARDTEEHGVQVTEFLLQHILKPDG